MPAKIISTQNAEHYKWGGPANSDADGWYLVRAPDLNIIEELMPPNTAETRHHHKHARQFFYVLSGTLSMEIEHHDFTIKTGEGIEIAPGQSHQARNKGPGTLRILVTSHPPSHGDKFDDPT